jgi:hypothetical protein
MAITPDIKLFGKWAFDDVEVRCSAAALATSQHELTVAFAGERHLARGLHRRQDEIRRLCSSHCWPISEEALPKGTMPYRREVNESNGGDGHVGDISPAAISSSPSECHLAIAHWEHGESVAR